MKKGMAILSYFGILVLIPIFAAKDNAFARYHANQGLIVCICSAISSVCSSLIGSILSGFLATIFSVVFGIISLLLFILSIIGIVNAAKGQQKPLPIIGGITILK